MQEAASSRGDSKKRKSKQFTFSMRWLFIYSLTPKIQNGRDRDDSGFPGLLVIPKNSMYEQKKFKNEK